MGRDCNVCPVILACNKHQPKLRETKLPEESNSYSNNNIDTVRAYALTVRVLGVKHVPCAGILCEFTSENKKMAHVLLESTELSE